MAVTAFDFDLRQSAEAHFFRVSPCRIEPGCEPDDTNVERCAPADAEWFGVYYGRTDAPELALADFDTEAEALAFARQTAGSRPVYRFDPINGERLA
jgi:hypothetical protein